MENIATVGLDLAKSIFQVHGIAENGKVLVVARCGDRYGGLTGPHGLVRLDVTLTTAEVPNSLDRRRSEFSDRFTMADWQRHRRIAT